MNEIFFSIYALASKKGLDKKIHGDVIVGFNPFVYQSPVR